jgi:hypothetical protein
MKSRLLQAGGFFILLRFCQKTGKKRGILKNIRKKDQFTRKK